MALRNFSRKIDVSHKLEFDEEAYGNKIPSLENGVSYRSSVSALGQPNGLNVANYPKG